MHCTSSLLAVALLTFSSVSPVFGTRPQIPEQWMRKQFDAEQDAAKKLAKRDYVCYDDGFLSQLQADPAVFSTFCSAYLTETDTATSTSDVTTTTTVSTIYTTVDQTYAGAATIPSSTVSVTVAAAGRHRKRQTAFVTGSISSTMLISATDPGAIMSTLSSCQQNPSPTGGQKSILNSYSSACSCFISPGIETILVSLTSTRTISGEDHAQYTETNTVTGGVTTVTVTAIPAPSSGPTIYTNASISATDSPIAGPTVPAGSLTPVSGSPTATTNSTTSTSSPSYPPLPNCPAQNGTTYTTQGQTFLILCGVNYAGPDNQGLIVPSLHQCIDDCALVNIAFSQDRCFGTSYDPTLGPGVQDCFFRTLPNSLLPIDNPNYISARLLSPLPPINGTNPTLPTGSGFMPSGSVYPTGSSISQNATSSVFPTLSINSSSFPSYSVSLTVSVNRTFWPPTGTGLTPSGTAGTGVFPSGTGVLPSGTDAAPTGTGVFPPSGTGKPRTGFSPSGTGIIPSGTGFTPSGTGIFPSGTGRANSTSCGCTETITLPFPMMTASSDRPHATEIFSIVETLTT